MGNTMYETAAEKLAGMGIPCEKFEDFIEFEYDGNCFRYSPDDEDESYFCLVMHEIAAIRPESMNLALFIANTVNSCRHLIKMIVLEETSSLCAVYEVRLNKDITLEYALRDGIESLVTGRNDFMNILKYMKEKDEK